MTLRDDRPGSPARVELSGATTRNWVAQTANLLVDTVGAPARVGVLLPLHWQVVTLLLGVVTSGAVAVVPEAAGDLAGCDAAFTTAGGAAAALAVGVPDVLAVSSAPLGGRLPAGQALPAAMLAVGVLDAGRELPAAGDHYGGPYARSWQVARGGDPVGPLPDLGLSTDDRVLTVAPPGTYAGLVLAILAPLHAGAAIVLLAGEPTGAVLRRACEQERATAVVGADVPGLRRLDAPG